MQMYLKRNEDIDLSKNPNNIVSFLFRERASNLLPQNAPCAAADIQIAWKLLLNVGPHVFADQHIFWLSTLLKNAGQVQEQSRQRINIEGFANLNLD